MHRLLRRFVGWTLLWTLLLLTIVIIVNLVGIQITDGRDHWQQWMNDHTGVFFIWRLLLYAATVYGWIWMRRRLLDREPEKETRQRLHRIEVAAMLAFITLEISQHWQMG